MENLCLVPKVVGFWLNLFFFFFFFFCEGVGAPVIWFPIEIPMINKSLLLGCFVIGLNRPMSFWRNLNVERNGKKWQTVNVFIYRISLHVFLLFDSPHLRPYT